MDDLYHKYKLKQSLIPNELFNIIAWFIFNGIFLGYY